LIVHRDLKPSNILVTAAGEIRLLDFGIAKLLGEGTGVRTHDTTALRPLTPTHASPEQITGGPISTATDVYALGVVLYQLLTGHHPHGVRADSPLELVRAIAEGEPRRPVNVVTLSDAGSPGDGQSHATPAGIARARSTTPDRLRRAIAGDLDNILLMALRKEPVRRYATVDQFADDLRRYLTGRPVRARPDTVAYRLGKFVARNRASVTAATATVIAIVGLVAFYTTRLTTERDNVRAESAKAAEVASFLTGLFETNDPNRSARQNVSARELLDRGLERIDADLGRQPGVRAAMLAAIGDAYRALAHYDRAGPALDSALAIRQRLHGQRHADVAASLLAKARLHYDRGEYDAAEPLAQQALDMDRGLLGNRNITVAHDLNVLSSIIINKGQPMRALPLVREIVDVRRELQGEEHPQYLTNLNNLGLLLSQTGDVTAADTIYRAIIEIRRRSGKDDPQLALTLENLAALLYLKGDLDSPVPLMREALSMRARIFGEDHTELSTPRNNLAAILRDRGEFTEAEALVRRVIGSESALRGENHWYVAYYEVSLALVLGARSNATEAERLLRRALEIYGQTFTADNSYVGNALVALGNLRLERGDAVEAEPLFRRAVRVFRQPGAGAVWPIAAAENGLGAALVATGRLEEGGPLLLHSDSVLAAERGASSSMARTSAGRVARFYESTGQPELAARFRARAR
jgi:serine/threonine-protein kinase